MNALTFNTGNASSEELTLICNKLDDISCEIMDNEENEDNFIALKSCREALNSINKARQADCKYTMYVNTHAAQVWVNQAVLNVEQDLSI
jgi:hypothetical protein